jgi:biotin transport system substrate-specific component
MQNIKGKQLAFCGLFIALFAISSKIQIPTPLIPITLQTAVLLLCVTTLSGFWSTFSVGVYIFCGLLGLPVFANGGGISYVLTPSFGYLIGFLIASLLKCLIVKQRLTSYKSLLICGIALLTIVHTVGNIYLYVVLKAHLQVEITLLQSFISNGALFIPIDLAWALFCPFIIKRINKQINL